MIVKPMTHVLIIIVEAIFKGPIFTLIKDKLADVTRTQKFYFLPAHDLQKLKRQ